MLFVCKEKLITNKSSCDLSSLRMNRWRYDMIKISHYWTMRYFIKNMVVYEVINNSHPEVYEIHCLEYMLIMLVNLILSIISSIKIVEYFVLHIYWFTSHKQIFVILPHHKQIIWPSQIFHRVSKIDSSIGYILNMSAFGITNVYLLWLDLTSLFSQYQEEKINSQRK